MRKSYSFKELRVGTYFHIVNYDTSYMKCEDIHGEHYMLELSRGKLFPPTTSRVTKVGGRFVKTRLSLAKTRVSLSNRKLRGKITQS